jgi:hypothetical protein
MSAPDLSEKRQHAEAVAYGRLLAVREILDALAEDRPAPRHRHGGTIIGGWHDCWRSDYRRGYERAVRVVKAMRLGVER